MRTQQAERARQAIAVESCKDVYPMKRVPKRYQGVRAGLAYALFLMDENRHVEARAEVRRLLDESAVTA